MPLTRRLILQKARHHPLEGSDGLTAHGFRNYFTPLPGYFSPFPHGTIHYRSHWVFRLTGWSRQIHSRFHEPAATRAIKTRQRAWHSRTGLSPTPVDHSKPVPLTTHKPSAGSCHTDTSLAHNPCHATPATVTHATGLAKNPLSFATTHGITIVFFSNGY